MANQVSWPDSLAWLSCVARPRGVGDTPVRQVYAVDAGWIRNRKDRHAEGQSRASESLNRRRSESRPADRLDSLTRSTSRPLGRSAVQQEAISLGIAASHPTEATAKG